MLSNDTHGCKTQIPTHTALPKKPGDIETELQQQRNTLFLNRGDGTFAEVAMYAGVQASGWSWGTMFMDVDLDGWQDILVANGHLWDIMDADVQEALQNRLTELSVAATALAVSAAAAQERRVPQSRRPDVRGREREVAFRHRGGLSRTRSRPRDLDGDGDLDVVVNRLARAGARAAQRRVGAARRRASRRRRAEHARRRREDPPPRRRGSRAGARDRRRRPVHVAQRLRGLVRDG